MGEAEKRTVVPAFPSLCTQDGYTSRTAGDQHPAAPSVFPTQSQGLQALTTS